MVRARSEGGEDAAGMFEEVPPRAAPTTGQDAQDQGPRVCPARCAGAPAALPRGEEDEAGSRPCRARRRSAGGAAARGGERAGAGAEGAASVTGRVGTGAHQAGEGGPAAASRSVTWSRLSRAGFGGHLPVTTGESEGFRAVRCAVTGRLPRPATRAEVAFSSEERKAVRDASCGVTGRLRTSPEEKPGAVTGRHRHAWGRCSTLVP